MLYKLVQNEGHADSARIWLIRLEKGEEILTSLTRFSQHFHLYSGEIAGLGAIQYAEIGWFDPVHRRYSIQTLQEDLELTSLIGNLATKENEPFFHIHVTLSNAAFEVVGGHLHKAIISITGEFILKTYEPAGLKRELDQATGLYLWSDMEKFSENGYI